jgi:transcriptional regulator with XRE-family HTH domain
VEREFLQRLHAELKISQADLGRALGISQPQMSRALRGLSPLNKEASAHALKLAEVHAPEIARDAVLTERTLKALRESDAFRTLVHAALALIHHDE